jgi:Mg2+ and Co2+ transporter CorA
MHPTIAVTAIAHQIQLAVAPVFLLAGIGSFLNVMAGRLARTVDRARELERNLAGLDDELVQLATAELRLLDRRMTLANLAISSCAGAAFFVCVLVAMLFVTNFAEVGIGRPIAWLFVVAMALLIVGLSLFLWEIRIAMRALRLRRDALPHRRI